MATQELHYFVLRNQDYENSVPRYDLPHDDDPLFKNGWLKYQNLTDKQIKEERLKHYNDVVKYRTSRYGLGQVILDDYIPKTDETFRLLEQGYYLITLSGAGHNNTTYKSKFVGEWKKTSIKDNLTIDKDFTWYREKEIDEGFYLLWKGKYTYSKDVILFSRTHFGYRDDELDKEDKWFESQIQYYGLMTVLDSPHSHETNKPHDDNYVYTVFLDNTKTDLMNFYINSDYVETEENELNFVIGGRGQTLNTIICQNNTNQDIQYTVGEKNVSPNSNVKFLNDLSFTANGSNNNEELRENKIVDDIINYYSYPNDNFGSSGGDLIQNKFDYFDKGENTEDGYVKITYYGLPDCFDIVTRKIKYTIDDEYKNDIEAKIYIIDNPDEFNNEKTDYEITDYYDNSPNINRIIAFEQTDIYVRIKDRDREIDLEKSTLGGTPLNELDKFKLKDCVKDLKFKITEIDNYRRKLSFKMPYFYDVEEYALNLVTKKRKFYFAVSIDDKIESVTIGGITYNKENEDELGIDRNLVFEAGKELSIEITFKEDNYTIIKPLLATYLRDCLDVRNINASNNCKQIISKFKMPDRDVVLFLKTERLYTLTVFKETSGGHIESIGGFTDNDLPIIKKYAWDEFIDLDIRFTSNSEFVCIDEDYLKIQYSQIEVSERKKNNQHQYEGNQTISFFMPDNDFTLYIKEKSPTFNLTFKTLEELNDLKIVGIYYIYENGQEKVLVPEWTGVEEKTNIEGEPPRIVYVSNSIEVIPSTNVKIRIEYETRDGNSYFYLDEDFLISQFQELTITRKSDLPSNHNINDVYDGDQYLSFVMPAAPVTLYLKTIDPRYTLSFDLEETQRPISNKKIEKILFYDSYNLKVVDFLNPKNLQVGILKETTVNIFVKFTDTETELDKEYIENQIIPIIYYDINTNNNLHFNSLKGVGDNKIEDSIFNQFGISTSNCLYYQRFDFKINDIMNKLSPVILKWMERFLWFWLTVAPDRSQVYEENFRQESSGLVNNTYNELGTFIKSVSVYCDNNKIDEFNLSENHKEERDVFENKIRIKSGSKIDLYVEFPRENLCLKETNIISSIPYADIEKPESFNDPHFSLSDPKLYQRIQFNMPEEDVYLNLHWIERYFKFSISKNFLQKEGDNNKIETVFMEIKNQDESLFELKEINFDEEYSVKREYKYILPEINLYVKFTDENRMLDRTHLRGQIAAIRTDESEEIEQKELETLNDFYHQRVWFLMPFTDLNLNLLWINRYYQLAITHNEYQLKYMLPDKRRQIESMFVNIENIPYSKIINDKSISEFIFDQDNKYYTIDDVPLNKTIDIYVKFTDIYQHLDKHHIYSQIPEGQIEEAGESIPQEQSNESHCEYYQHIQFIMPNKDTYLNLKWEERLFCIQYNIMELFFVNTSIYDLFIGTNNNGTYNYKDISNKLPATPLEVGQSIFPYYTYPTVMVDGTDGIPIPTPNNIKIYSTLTKAAEFKKGNESSYINGTTPVHSIISGIVNQDGNLSSDEKENVFLNFFMPKNNIFFFIKVGFNEGIILFQNDFTTGESIPLVKGRYTIWLAGAKGGNGGRSGAMVGNRRHNGKAGAFGAGIRFEIEVEQSTVLEYKLGQTGGRGGNGQRASIGQYAAAGGGGGGGGTSVITFSSNIRLINDIRLNNEILFEDSSMIQKFNSNNYPSNDTSSPFIIRDDTSMIDNNCRTIGVNGGAGGQGGSGAGTGNTGGPGGPGGKFDKGSGENGKPGIEFNFDAMAGDFGTGGVGFKYTTNEVKKSILNYTKDTPEPINPLLSDDDDDEDYSYGYEYDGEESNEEKEIYDEKIRNFNQFIHPLFWKAPLTEFENDDDEVTNSNNNTINAYKENNFNGFILVKYNS